MQTDETTTDRIEGVNGGESGQEPPSDPPAAAPDPEPVESLLAHRRPRNVSGHYLVLAAFPPHGDAGPAFIELGWTKAHGDDHAKRIASRCPLWGPRILAGAKEPGGVVLRAVAGRSWPKTEATKVKADPRLVIG